MISNKLVVCISKNAFYKTDSYHIKINGTLLSEINRRVLKSEFELPSGKYLVEVSNGSKRITKEIFLTANQLKRISIQPTLSN